MSTSEAALQDAPSYGERQVPDVAWQLLLVTTPVPSRLRTVSWVSQAPDWVIQCGKARTMRSSESSNVTCRVPGHGSRAGGTAACGRIAPWW
jgi:hypothetical protein